MRRIAATAVFALCLAPSLAAGCWEDAGQRYGLVLNPLDRTTPFVTKSGDRLVVLAEEDG